MYPVESEATSDGEFIRGRTLGETGNVTLESQAGKDVRLCTPSQPGGATPEEASGLVARATISGEATNDKAVVGRTGSDEQAVALGTKGLLNLLSPRLSPRTFTS